MLKFQDPGRQVHLSEEVFFEGTSGTLQLMIAAGYLNPTNGTHPGRALARQISA